VGPLPLVGRAAVGLDVPYVAIQYPSFDPPPFVLDGGLGPARILAQGVLRGLHPVALGAGHHRGSGITGHVAPDQQAAVVDLVGVPCQGQGSDVGQAPRPAAVVPGQSQRGQEDTHEDGDDRDHHEEFNEGEPPSPGDPGTPGTIRRRSCRIVAAVSVLASTHKRRPRTPVLCCCERPDKVEYI